MPVSANASGNSIGTSDAGMSRVASIVPVTREKARAERVTLPKSLSVLVTVA